MPTTEAKNSIELFGMVRGVGKYSRQAIPVVTENPPMPEGQASVITRFVGRRNVMRLRLIPVAALASRHSQSCMILISDGENLIRFHLECLRSI